ncbi:hypothetical protein [Sporolituus thermophilus]|uniref:Uncharacterized protein n=1 Tax=Sporolituus thermophilus DSM 23256 TaxID=1123285 RepID=A0A1G7LPA9_9FIRM|nr:hypothetical protein [Sporolituus thermophilus]SDF51231.1 hypothetical protein SAMN05660235_01841 [Sporolituus thermophilus DSM 23256]
MKKLTALVLAALILATAGTAFANLDDTRATIAARYSEYRLVIDTDNQLWTKAEWEATGYKKAKAASFLHAFERQGLHIQMEVQYENNSPGALVKAQRFTPDLAIKIKDFKHYFPEIYALIASPKAEAFATYRDLTRNFQEAKSPVTMGVVVKTPPAPGKGGYYTLIAFNVQDEGRLLKDAKYINENTYIREFTIERIFRSAAQDALGNGDWTPIKKYF